MHLIHKAGEKLYVDFSGKTVDIVNQQNGLITKAELFVGVLPASGYPFIKAIASQKKRDLYPLTPKTPSRPQQYPE